MRSISNDMFLYVQINSSSSMLHAIPNNKTKLPQVPLTNCIFLFLNTEQNKISKNVQVVKNQYFKLKRTLMQLCIYTYKSFRVQEFKKKEWAMQ